MTPEDAVEEFAAMVTRVTPFNQPWFCGVSYGGSNNIDVYCHTEQELKPIIVGIVIAVVINIIFSLICWRK